MSKPYEHQIKSFLNIENYKYTDAKNALEWKYAENWHFHYIGLKPNIEKISCGIVSKILMLTLNYTTIVPFLIVCTLTHTINTSVLIPTTLIRTCFIEPIWNLRSTICIDCNFVWVCLDTVQALCSKPIQGRADKIICRCDLRELSK